MVSCLPVEQNLRLLDPLQLFHGPDVAKTSNRTPDPSNADRTLSRPAKSCCFKCINLSLVSSILGGVSSGLKEFLIIRVEVSVLMLLVKETDFMLAHTVSGQQNRSYGLNPCTEQPTGQQQQAPVDK
jgi:hypothetical protein